MLALERGCVLCMLLCACISRAFPLFFFFFLPCLQFACLSKWSGDWFVGIVPLHRPSPRQEETKPLFGRGKTGVSVLQSHVHVTIQHACVFLNGWGLIVFFKKNCIMISGTS